VYQDTSRQPSGSFHDFFKSVCHHVPALTASPPDVQNKRGICTLWSGASVCTAPELTLRCHWDETSCPPVDGSSLRLFLEKLHTVSSLYFSAPRSGGTHNDEAFLHHLPAIGPALIRAVRAKALKQISITQPTSSNTHGTSPTW